MELDLGITNPVFAAIGLAIAILTTAAINKGSYQPLVNKRFNTIDGLRGYLAYFVFLHHSLIWFFYLKTGKWQAPPSNLFNQFGQASVALFFMITAFLFLSKLIDARNKKINWERLYISRFLRLTPLYFVAILIMSILVAISTNYSLNVPTSELLASITQWLAFTIPGTPDINALSNTSILTAGVTWSLPYEWTFYFLLPFIAILLRIPVSISIKVSIFLCLTITVTLFHPNMKIFSSFLGGLAAAILVRYEIVRQFSSTSLATFVLIGCLSFLVLNYSKAFSNIPLILLSIVFVIIAAGNTVFGFLNLQVSRNLGEITYSIYLLHGMVLFSTFNLILDSDLSKGFSPTEYWAIIYIQIPIIIIISHISFRFIETPFIKMTDKANTLFNKKP